MINDNKKAVLIDRFFISNMFEISLLY